VVTDHPATVGDLLDRADGELAAGRGAEAVALYEQAAERCRATDDLEGWTRAVLGTASAQVFGSEPGRLPAQIHEVYQRVEAPEPRTRLAAALARCWVYAGDAARALPFAEEALRQAEPLADPVLLADALDAALAAHWGPDELDQRRLLAGRLVETAAHVLDPDTRLKAHLWGLQVACEDLNLPAMHRQMRALERLGEESPRAAFFAASRRLMLDLLRGRPDTLAPLLAAVERASEQVFIPDAWMIQGGMRVYTALQTGDADTCAEVAAIAEAYALGEGVEAVVAETSLWWLGAGRPERARALIRTLAGPALDALPRDVNWLLTLQTTLQVALALGERDLVAQAAGHLAPYEGRAVVNAGAFMFHGVTDDPLSRAFAELGDPERAARLRAAALATYERIGATWWRDQLLAAAPPAGAEGAARARRFHLRPADGGLWTVGAGGAVLPSLKGLGYLHQLLRAPGQEVAALDLVGRDLGHSSAAQADLGPVLDDRARQEYRQRLRDLDDEIAEAEDWADAGRLEALRGEREALIAELAGATGLGGTARTTGSTAERARVAVRKAIVAALDRIGEVDESMARHLRDRVRTGTACRYEPDQDHPVDWVL